MPVNFSHKIIIVNPCGWLLKVLGSDWWSHTVAVMSRSSKTALQAARCASPLNALGNDYLGHTAFAGAHSPETALRATTHDKGH
ncbi:hypothetical protein [Candidatus Avelusimicrobium sp.]|uniref:hypothetical protein n=1 Tax=Candidatus Avelusimicrobium sp. TaxID=3048833 RepID=UPI003D7E7FB2